MSGKTAQNKKYTLLSVEGGVNKVVGSYDDMETLTYKLREALDSGAVVNFKVVGDYTGA